MDDDDTPKTTKQEEIHALDQTRQRIQQITQSLTEIERSLMYSESVPNWPSLQKSSHLLLGALQTLLRTTTETHSKFLQSAHPYPTPSFPALAQDAILQSLLRKKQFPEVEDWVIEGLKHASSFCDVGDLVDVGEKADDDDGSRRGLREEDFDHLWEEAGPWESEIAHQVIAGGDDEEEEEGSDEDEGDEDEAERETKGDDGDVKMGEAREPEAPRLPLATMLQFMSTGSVPRVVDHAQYQREMLAQRDAMMRQRQMEEAQRRQGAFGR